MIKAVAALASARNQVDRSIALGEAIPRLVRLRRIVLWGLVAAVVILSVSYIHISSEMDSVRKQQKLAQVERNQILHQLEVAQGDRWAIMSLLGKQRASTASTP